MSEQIPASSPHLSDAELSAWLQNALGPTESRRIETHLESCDACAERIDGLNPERDELIACLQSQPLDPYADTFGSSPTRHEEETPGNDPSLNVPVASRWKIERLFAKGGIGEVWLAQDQLLGRPVVLKKLRSEYAQHEAVQARFLREAKVTARLSHPGTAYILDLAEQGPDSYYVMSLVEGRTLTAMIAEYHANPGDELLHGLLQTWVSVTKTIAFAHLKRVLHRDIKSENIVVGSHGQVTVIDWGLAKMLDDPAPPADDAATPEIATLLTQETLAIRATQPGARLGTPVFMAPEQARGDAELTPLTDVYGLAAMLYEILTGVAPFTGKDVEEVLARVIEKPPTPPATINPNVCAELQAICLQGLAKQPQDRQTSATEIGEQVSNWIALQTTLQRKTDEREKFFALSRDLLAVLDLQGNFVQVNHAWEKILGWSAEELLGTHCAPIIVPEDREEVAARLVKVQIQGPVENTFECRLFHRNGSVRMIEWSGTPMADEQKIYAVGRDVTQHRASERRFASLVESAPDAMVIANDQGRIELVNSQAERLFGYSREELLGQAIEFLLPEQYAATHQDMVQRYLQSPNIRPIGVGRVLTARRKSGEEFSVEISLSPVESEGSLLVSSLIREVRR